MPIIYWEDSEVWEFLNDVMRVPHCDMYDKGYNRIGCILCPLKNDKERLKDAIEFPHHKHKWIEVILKKYENNPEFVDKYLPSGVDVFETSLVKDTAESFGNKYPQRWVESAEACFDYWIHKDSYKKWFSKHFIQQKLF